MGGCKKRKWSSHLINYPKLNKLIPFHCCSHVGHNLNIDYSCGHRQRFRPADKLCETEIQEWHWGLLSGDSVLGLTCSVIWHWQTQSTNLATKLTKITSPICQPSKKLGDPLGNTGLELHDWHRSNIAQKCGLFSQKSRVFQYDLVFVDNGKNLQRWLGPTCELTLGIVYK